MSFLPHYVEPPAVLQTADSFTNANLLAANIAEIISVPYDSDGQLAKVVTFKSTGDFYAKPMIGDAANELVTNGTFAEYVTNGAFASDTDWTKGTGWTIAAGVATATGAISTVLSQTSAITLIAGRTYTLTFTVTSFTAGTVTPSVGGTAGTARGSAATFTETIVASTTQVLAFTGAGFTGSIDNVTVTAWELGTGWTTDGSTAIATGAISTDLKQTIISTPFLVSGGKYLVTFTATRSAGSVAVSLGGGAAGTSRSSAATFSEVITAGATQVILFATTGFTGTIDNVTVTKCIAVPGDTTDGTSGDLNPTGYFLNRKITSISIVSAGTPIVTSSFFK